MGLPRLMQYEATHPLYGVAFSNNPQHPHRIALTSFLTGPANKLFVVDAAATASYPQSYAPQADFANLATGNLSFPATKVAWEPRESLARHDAQGGRGELLATTGDVLRLWELKQWEGSDGTRSGYVGRNGYNDPSAGEFLLAERSVLSNKGKQHAYNLPPITSFSWNATAPASIVTCSTDTTATLWDINTSQALTQLIAHDRAVYDLSWLPQSADIFVSVGADGSLRAFDLRQLEHSTILYETPNSSPLSRIAFSNREHRHMLACFSMDDSRTLILDMRSPGQPVAELLGHQAPLGAIAWGSGGSGTGATGGGFIASGGDDAQLLVYDLTRPLPTEGESGGRSGRSGNNGPYALSPPATPSNRTPSPSSTRAAEIQPVRAWSSAAEINNLIFSHSGEWVGCVSGSRLSVLQL
ncbi:Protein TRANSPARENT TESTA GLABRA 1 [Vanrija pseudolonga]|uniref:Protein TRANSPARENT TESTA GLABRA 1 n=1 Tax=Vanrija pseudolonga TaxID=143232 RepID=A0AAF0YHU3_9TREE|nr:Protein TRANSPARENT TESTA GLABRA 1 [Vanrija pseudolonga]